jgi:hypothetical protein
MKARRAVGMEMVLAVHVIQGSRSLRERRLLLLLLLKGRRRGRRGRFRVGRRPVHGPTGTFVGVVGGRGGRAGRRARRRRIVVVARLDVLVLLLRFVKLRRLLVKRRRSVVVAAAAGGDLLRWWNHRVGSDSVGRFMEELRLRVVDATAAAATPRGWMKGRIVMMMLFFTPR